MLFSKKPFSATFDEIASEFSQTRQSDWGEFNLIKESLLALEKKSLDSHVIDIRGSKKILDLGCGNGRAIPFLEDRGDVACFDSSEKLLKIAKDNFPGRHFSLGKMEEGLPFKTEKFDEVWSVASFHHLLTKKDRISALGEIHRILNENGILVMTVWNLFQDRFFKERIKAIARSMLLPHWSARDIVIPFGNRKIPRFHHAFNIKSLKKLLEDNFFEVLDIFGSKGDKKESLKNAHNICVIARKILRKDICGVPFDLISKNDALNKLFEYSKAHDTNSYFKTADSHIAVQLSHQKQKFITTPNPEMCIEASKNPEFLKILKTADLSLADGTGIIWAAKSNPKNIISTIFSLIKFAFSTKKIGNFERSQGSDIFRQFCLHTKSKVFLLGGNRGVAQKCGEYFAKKNPDFKLAGFDDGSSREEDEYRICGKINQSGAEVLFVAFGAPKQELWIHRNLKKFPHVKFAMGVGGSFDFIAGSQKRAPQFMQKLGIEWIWRLIREPKRMKRIWNATYNFVELKIKS